MKLITISQKRTCKGCRACIQEYGYNTCELRYDIERPVNPYGYGKPLEPCPKPLTISDYLECLELYKKG